MTLSNHAHQYTKEVYMKILMDACNYLNKDGELWFVMNKDHGAKSTIEKMKDVYDLTILDKKKGFFVISCKKR